MFGIYICTIKYTYFTFVYVLQYNVAYTVYRHSAHFTWDYGLRIFLAFYCPKVSDPILKF